MPGRAIAGGALVGPRGRTSAPHVGVPAGAIWSGFVWKRTAGGGAAIVGRAFGIVAALGFASTGAWASTGALLIACGLTGTTFAFTD